MNLTIEKNNFKKLTTLASIALCATSLAFTNNEVKADTINDNKYTVQSGDTLWDIAQKYQIDLDEFESLNHKDSNHTLIMPGEVLKLPKHKGATSGAGSTVATNTQPTQSQTDQSAQSSVAQSQPQNNVATNQVVTTAPSSNSAKEWIAQRESGGSYSARNGQYIGRYQLSSSYLNGDYSPANQERTADKYVTQRYGSWAGAKAFWQSHGWY